MINNARLSKNPNVKNLKDFYLEEIKGLLTSLGQPVYRGEQLFAWLYKGAPDFSTMTNLPKSLLERLAEEGYNSGTLKVLKKEVSKDKTIKILFELEDGEAIETVLMSYKYGYSVCISSQVGCLMGCKFCASTLAGKIRDLSPGEMIDQFISMERLVGERINHLVVMGIGEPFDNYENLVKALRILHDENGRSLSYRNMTVSTCGLMDKIQRFSEDLPQVNLAISLHGPDDETRELLMPINKVYRIHDLIKTCRSYTAKTGRRISFEYALIEGVNDSLYMAKKLAKLLKGMNAHVNLITLNKVEEVKYKGSKKVNSQTFMDELMRQGIQVTMRREMGQDIRGACGQLRLASKDILSV